MSMDQLNKRWIKFFVTIAQANAAMSKDPSTQVGAVIVRPNLTIASQGWNGLPRTCLDLANHLNNREAKYPRMIHAEMNAVLAAREPLGGYTIITTCPPCDRCMAHLAQAGIKAVYCPPPTPDFMERWSEAYDRFRNIADENGITVVIYYPQDLE